MFFLFSWTVQVVLGSQIILRAQHQTLLYSGLKMRSLTSDITNRCRTLDLRFALDRTHTHQGECDVEILTQFVQAPRYLRPNLLSPAYRNIARTMPREGEALTIRPPEADPRPLSMICSGGIRCLIDLSAMEVRCVLFC